MDTEFFTTESAVALPRTSGKASLHQEKGIFIMHLYGGHEEMGRQCADLVNGIVDDYVARYYEGFLEKLIEHAVGHISKSLPHRLSNLLYSIFAYKNRKNIGPSMSGLVKGFLEGMGGTEKDGIRLAVFADILHFLAGKAFSMTFPPSCSGFFARGAATKDGKLVIGRNFDFYGRGIWNSNQCITVFHPENGKPFLWLGALGLPVGGFGLNENGIGLMIFTNFCKDVSIGGMPLFTIATEILETAASCEDAVKIASRAPRIGANTLLITDSKNRDARVMSWSSHRMEVLSPENDLLWRTNHYLTPELKELEVAPPPWVRHSNSRFERLRVLLNEKYGKLTPEDGAAILSNPVDFYEDRKRVAGDVLAAVNNALSIVLAPDDDAIYIAHGSFPVCNADKYLGYKISELMKGGKECAAADIPGGGYYNETEKLAINHYQEAWTEYLDRGDKMKAVYHCRRAAELCPDEPIFHRVAGVLLMKMGKFESAKPHMLKNAEYPYKDIRVKAEALMWNGRCLDLCGCHTEAIEWYKKAVSTGEVAAGESAKKSINKPFTKKEMIAIDVEFIVGSPIGK